MAAEDFKMDSILRASLHEPTEIEVLKLIQKDNKALGANYTMHVWQNLDKDKDHAAVKRTMIVLKLIDDGLIKQSGHLGYELTRDGEIYLKRNNPEWSYWSARYAAGAIWVGAAAILIAVAAWLFPRQNLTMQDSIASPVVYKLDSSITPSSKKGNSAHKLDTPTPSLPPNAPHQNKQGRR
jgi:hypothetical protein